MHDNATPKKTTLATLQQLHEESGLPYRSLYDLVIRGHLQRVDLGSSRIWVRRRDFEQLIEQRTERLTETALA